MRNEVWVGTVFYEPKLPAAYSLFIELRSLSQVYKRWCSTILKGAVEAGVMSGAFSERDALQNGNRVDFNTDSVLAYVSKYLDLNADYSMQQLDNMLAEALADRSAGKAADAGAKREEAVQKELLNVLDSIIFLNGVNKVCRPDVPKDVLLSLLDFFQNAKPSSSTDSEADAFAFTVISFVSLKCASVSNHFSPLDFYQHFISLSKQLGSDGATDFMRRFHDLICPDGRKKGNLPHSSLYTKVDTGEFFKLLAEGKYTISFVESCIDGRVFLKPSDYATLYASVSRPAETEKVLSLDAAIGYLQQGAKVQDLPSIALHANLFGAIDSIRLAQKRIEPEFAAHFSGKAPVGTIVALHPHQALGMDFLADLASKNILPGTSNFTFFTEIRLKHQLPFSEIEALMAKLGGPYSAHAEALLNPKPAEPSVHERTPQPQKPKTHGIPWNGNNALASTASPQPLPETPVMQDTDFPITAGMISRMPLKDLEKTLTQLGFECVNDKGGQSMYKLPTGGGHVTLATKNNDARIVASQLRGLGFYKSHWDAAVAGRPIRNPPVSNRQANLNLTR